MHYLRGTATCVECVKNTHVFLVHILMVVSLTNRICSLSKLLQFLTHTGNGRRIDNVVFVLPRLVWANAIG